MTDQENNKETFDDISNIKQNLILKNVEKSGKTQKKTGMTFFGLSSLIGSVACVVAFFNAPFLLPYILTVSAVSATISGLVGIQGYIKQKNARNNLNNKSVAPTVVANEANNPTQDNTMFNELTTSSIDQNREVKKELNQQNVSSDNVYVENPPSTIADYSPQPVHHKKETLDELDEHLKKSNNSNAPTNVNLQVADQVKTELEEDLEKFLFAKTSNPNLTSAAYIDKNKKTQFTRYSLNK